MSCGEIVSSGHAVARAGAGARDQVGAGIQVLGWSLVV